MCGRTGSNTLSRFVSQLCNPALNLGQLVCIATNGSGQLRANIRGDQNIVLLLDCTQKKDCGIVVHHANTLKHLRLAPIEFQIFQDLNDSFNCNRVGGHDSVHL